MRTAAVTTATSSTAIDPASAKVRTPVLERGTPRLPACASLSKSGARRASSRLISPNSCRILFSSQFKFIKLFRLLQQLSELLLAAFVMRANRAERNAHHRGCLLKAQTVIEDQLQSFTLTPGQECERPLEHASNFCAIR